MKGFGFDSSYLCFFEQGLARFGRTRLLKSVVKLVLFGF
jgi:hypothetical protein